jgi:carbonic anhydrase
MSTQPTMPVFSELESANAAYVASGEHRELSVRPARQLAVVTCMDSRIDVYAVLGLELGDVHVIRTAGARVTDDVLRSLALSTHMLGTRQIAVIAHTDCGLKDDGHFTEHVTQVMGPAAASRSWFEFTDPAESVRRDCDVLLSWDLRPREFVVAGYVLDIEEGRLVPAVQPTRATASDEPA